MPTPATYPWSRDDYFAAIGMIDTGDDSLGHHRHPGRRRHRRIALSRASATERHHPLRQRPLGEGEARPDAAGDQPRRTASRTPRSAADAPAAPPAGCSITDGAYTLPEPNIAEGRPCRASPRRRRVRLACQIRPTRRHHRAPARSARRRRRRRVRVTILTAGAWSGASPSCSATCAASPSSPSGSIPTIRFSCSTATSR